MGFFKTETASPDDARMRAYLADAPPGCRVDWLTWAAYLQIADTPIAQADQAATVVDIEALDPAGQIVRRVVAQDIGLLGRLVRGTLVNLKVMLGQMSGDPAVDIPRAFAIMGVESREDGDMPVFLPGAGGETLNAEQAAGARSVAGIAEGLLLLVLTDPRERPQLGMWAVYRELFEAALGSEREMLGHHLIAWVDILIARTLATGAARRFPFLTDEFRHVPPLTEAGWYPNPSRHGEVVDGIAPLQREWDSGYWRDGVRIRSGNDWKYGLISLRDPSE